MGWINIIIVPKFALKFHFLTKKSSYFNFFLNVQILVFNFQIETKFCWKIEKKISFIKKIVN